MQVLANLQDFKSAAPLVLGIGNFDGFHLGHQKLIQEVIQRAKKLKGISAVLTFREHPYHVLHPKLKQKLLTPGEYKLFFLSQTSLDVCFWIHFTQAFSHIEAEEFVEEILVKQLNVKEVCLGYNARFGHGRKGDAELMQQLAKKFHFEFEGIQPVKIENDFVSSSRIRQLVEKGDLKQTALCLGRPYSVLGKVVEGAGRGKTLGFPTANLEIHHEIMPPIGVYAVTLRKIQFPRLKEHADADQVFHSKTGPWLQGVLNYGFRPTFEASPCAVAEVFVLDFDKDLYGETLELVFHQRLREEIAFDTTEALKHQISQDIAKARVCLAQAVK